MTFTASGNCTVTVSTVHITGAGSCTITAHQAGDASYNPAPDVPQTFSIGQATPVITWANPADITYPAALGATQLNATANVPGSFVYTPAASTVLNAGNGQTLHVEFTPTDSANYTTATKDVSINVLKGDQTITFAALADKTFGDADFAVSATASSSLTVIFTASGNCSITGLDGPPHGSRQLHDHGPAGWRHQLQRRFGRGAHLLDRQGRPDDHLRRSREQDVRRCGLRVSASASSSLTVSFTASGNCTVTGRRSTSRERAAARSRLTRPATATTTRRRTWPAASPSARLRRSRR